jgi:hypothetical protein
MLSNLNKSLQYTLALDAIRRSFEENSYFGIYAFKPCIFSFIELNNYKTQDMLNFTIDKSEILVGTTIYNDINSNNDISLTLDSIEYN